MNTGKLLSDLISPKGIIGMILIVFVVAVLMLVLTKFQDSPIGQNSASNKTLEDTKQSLGLLTFWYFFIDDIEAVILFIVIAVAIIAAIVYFYKEHNNFR